MALLNADTGTDREKEKNVDVVDDRSLDFRDECINSFNGVNIPASIVSILADSYYDLESVKNLSENDLRAGIPDIGRKRAKLIVTAVRKFYKMDVIEAVDLADGILELGRLSTGSIKLNELLDGGIEQGCTTEFNGSYSTGKTQLAHELAIMTQLPEDSGGYTPVRENAITARAAFVDTEKTFSRKRTFQMSKRFDFLDPREVLRNIKYYPPTSAIQEVQACNEILKIAEKENIKTVIFDSILKNIKQENWGNWFRRADYINQIICLIEEMEDRGLTVITMNQIRGNPDRNVVEGTGGEAWHHAPKHIIQLSWYAKRSPTGCLREEDFWRTARAFDSPTLNPRTVAPFKLDELGILDIPAYSQS
ncbi:MAG: hypothetical protein ACFFD4_12890 [Candidatus Odinarchaeota archaeon]